MKIRLIVPVIYRDRLYQAGAVLEISNTDGSKLVNDRIAVPEPDPPVKQVIRPAEVRRVRRYG